jgi:hypothetical protein
MAQRRIGQEGFRFGARAERQTSLNEPLAAQVLVALSGGERREGLASLGDVQGLLLATWV